MKKLWLATLFGITICLNLTAQSSTVTYQSSNDDFANPERGFYRYTATFSGSYSPLNATTMASWRQLHTPPTASYDIYSTLVFRYFYLEDFKTSNISQSYLDNMQADFDAARIAGVKLIPRFAYTNQINSSGCGSSICPPYGDAAKSWVLTHISQLKPILQTNSDVIAAVQMGFIGIWGENYYTDFFGDASQAPDYKLLDNEWQDRFDVITALLDAVPSERMLQVRYVNHKQKMVYGVNAATNVAPLMQNEAFLGTTKARLGYHNDCYLASWTDFGTYNDFGSTSTPSGPDTTNLKPYLASDSKFVVVGGETCGDGYTPFNECTSASPPGIADQELERMHYSYLNSQYNNNVNNDWVNSGGCMDDIKKRLGYRFELQSGVYTNFAQRSQVFDIDIDIKNVGYASPYNARGLELMLRNTSNAEVWYVPLNYDVRYWFAGNSIHNITETICIPSDIPLGSYELFLHFPDPMTDLYGRSEYSIRLANQLPDNSDVWEAATGYNKLGHTLQINSTAGNPSCNGEITLSKLSTALPVELLAFTAISKENFIQLEWKTGSEMNNEGFYVERRTNNTSFSKIAWIEGNNSSNITKYYTFNDREVEPNTDYYYRLVQLDLDGTSSNSSIVTAKIFGEGKVENIHIFPNPTTNELQIVFDNQSQEIRYIKIYNLAGLSVFEGNYNKPSLNISSLPEGVYFVEIYVEQNKIIKKIIKQ